MTLAIASLSVLVILSNFMLENVATDSSTVFQALEKLTKAVERLEAKIQLQTTSINNIEAKVEIQDAKNGVQVTILRDLQAELVKVQNSSLNNLQVTTTAMQVNLLNIFEEKFSLLSNLVNNSMAENQKQVTSLKSLDNKVDSQGALLTNLTANVNVQATSLTNMVAESKLQNNLLNKLVTTLTTQANEFNNFNTKIDTQTSILTNVQARSNLQAALLGKMNSNQELQATSLSGLEAASKTHKNLLHDLQNTAVRRSTLLNNLLTKADLQATSINNLVAEVEWHEPVAHFKTNRTIVAFVGDDVEMWCVVRGTPLPEMKWTRENGTLSDRVVVENNGKVLRIKNLRSSDDGAYVCFAANGVGNPVSQAVHLEVYNKYRQCHRMIESDRGNLEIEPSNSSCLCVIKLQNTTGFRLELDPLMTESILVIPEQNSSNSNAQSIWINGSKNVSSYEFEGTKLAILVLPGRERMSLNWRGLAANVPDMKSTTKFVNDSEGTLEWEPTGDGSGKIFWEFSHEMPVALNWTLNTDSAAQDPENPCENMFFSVMQIRRDGNISEIQKTCDGSSEGSLKLENNSQVLFLLHIKSLETARSKLRVLWKHRNEPIKKIEDGVIAGTWSGAFVIPLSSTQTQTVASGYIYGLTFDWNSQKIYYLKSRVGIMRSNLDGSESNILLSDSSLLFGMTIEPTSGNLYIGNLSSRTIRVCDNDANKCSTIVNSSVNDIAFHRFEGLLFWSSSGGDLFRANLDGSNATTLLKGRKLGSLDVDEHEGRLYWGSEEGIGSCDLNGQDMRMIPNVNIHTSDVAINNDTVYYAAWETNTIHAISKSGRNKRLVAQLTRRILHITFVSTQVSNQPGSPCKESKCAHLCVLVTRWTYRCTCPDAKVLNPDGKTCNA